MTSNENDFIQWRKYGVVYLRGNLIEDPSKSKLLNSMLSHLDLKYKYGYSSGRFIYLEKCPEIDIESAMRDVEEVSTDWRRVRDFESNRWYKKEVFTVINAHPYPISHTPSTHCVFQKGVNVFTYYMRQNLKASVIERYKKNALKILDFLKKEKNNEQ